VWVDRSLTALEKKCPSWWKEGVSRDRLSRAAQNMVEDALFSHLPLLMTPKELAVCAVTVAARAMGLEDIPDSFVDSYASSKFCSHFATIVLGEASGLVAAAKREPPSDE
jgi:hypothetical protein